MSAPAEVLEEGRPAPNVRVKVVCSHCDRVITRNARKGYYVRCPDCGTVNAGPALLAEQGKPKAEGARRRARRRGAAADTTGSPAPAPVRRKRTTSAPAPAGTQTGGAKEPAAAPAAGTAPGQGPPAPPRRGLFDRILYGDGGE